MKNEDKAIELNSKGVKAHKGQSYKEAIRYYEQALNITDISKSDRASILFNKAGAYEKIEDANSAKQCYTDALIQDPNHKRAEKALNDLHTPLIQKLAYAQTTEARGELAGVFYDLGSLLQNIGQSSKEVKYCTDAAIFYQYGLAVIKEINKPSILEERNADYIKKVHKELSTLKQDIVSIIANQEPKSTNEDINPELEQNKKILSDLRLETDKAVKTVEYHNNNNSIASARELFADIASSMKGFLAKLYEESEREIGSPPCKYAVIGLGSMALKQMTPYSDLEFAIITENEDYKKDSSSQIKNYFKNLTHLVHFKIINLGETSIPFSRFGVDLDHLIPVAVNLDLGGKTPLGRIEKDKPYDLIQTAEGMLKYLRNVGDKTSHIDKNLPYILEKVCYVYGSATIVEQYQKKAQNFLFVEKNPDGLLNCEARALKVLHEGAVEFNYLHPSKPASVKTQGNIEALQPGMLLANTGELIDVKQGIYRLPDRLIYSWGLCYGIEGDSVWDIISKLEEKGIIKKEAANNLNYAVTFATTLRLKTYLHHNKQREDISAWHTILKKDANNQVGEIFCLSQEELTEKGALFKYFYTAMPLHKKLETFCKEYKSIHNKEVFFRGEDFYSDNDTSKGLIYYRLLQYDKAKKHLENVINLNAGIFPTDLNTILTLENIYNILGDDKAQKLGKFCLQSINSMPSECKPFFYYNLGVSCSRKGDYVPAEDYCLRSIKEYKNVHGEEHRNTAWSVSLLSSIYFDQGNFPKALEHMEESLKKFRLIYKDKPHHDIANNLNNLGECYRLLGKFPEALKYQLEGLDMFTSIYQGQPHTHVAHILKNLGLTYSDLMVDCHNNRQYELKKTYYKLAQDYCNKSLQMWDMIFNNQPHVSKANTLNALGIAHFYYSNFEEAKKYHLKAIDMQKACNEYTHQETARYLNNLAHDCLDLKDYGDAKKYSFQSWEMHKKLYGEIPNPDAAMSLCILGSASMHLGSIQTATKYFQAAKKEIKFFKKHHFHNAINNTIDGQLRKINICGDNPEMYEMLEQFLRMYNAEPLGDSSAFAEHE